jgi:hypothetical protein
VDIAERLDIVRAGAAAAGANADSVSPVRLITEGLDRQVVTGLHVLGSGLGQSAEQVDGVPERAEQPADLDLDAVLDAAVWLCALLRHHSSPDLEQVAPRRSRNKGLRRR